MFHQKDKEAADAFTLASSYVVVEIISGACNRCCWLHGTMSPDDDVSVERGTAAAAIMNSGAASKQHLDVLMTKGGV